jgi:glycosyltransferase involved in cell wall biosynthesis
VTAPLCSVVVGVKNGAKSLEKLIDSFVAQTLDRKELVIKDGGSTDGTLDILERRKADIAYWTSAPDRSLYDAWNTAIDHTRGKYICFLGCDDELADPVSLERLARHAESADPPELICSINALIDDDGKFVKLSGNPWSWTRMKRALVLAHPGLMHRRDLFERYGKFDDSYTVCGDYEFLLRLGPNPRTVFVEQITVRVGSNGMSHRRWKTTLGELWRLHARHPEVGTVDATKNLSGNVARLLYRKLRGRR